MEIQEKIDYIIGKSEKYISSNLYCKEDRVFHRGRNSYLWTILYYLYKKDKDPYIFSKVKNSLENYKKCFSKNENEDLILLPGLEDRGNYSTNAIDCGIFLDALNDIRKIIEIPKYLDDASRDIFFNYAFNKLKNRSPIHNQYLWLLSGFSRSISYFCLKDKKKYENFVLEIINSFYENNDEFGFCVYSDLSDDLKHITTYYHSRCLAFASYSLENISYSNPFLEDKFYKGALFLAKMFKRDGIKSLSLESKRYYFHNEYELASIPYDLYVFEKAYFLSKEEIWLDLAERSINHLYSKHKKDFVKAYLNTEEFCDWQCNIMRTSHVAWITRLSNKFLLKLDSHVRINKNYKQKLNIQKFINKYENNNKSSLLVKSNDKNNYQFLPTKSPISSLYGQRSIGLQPTKHMPVSNLFIIYPFEYRTISFNLINFKSLLDDFKNIKATFLQIKDTIIRKWDLKKALEIFKFHIISYFFVRYTFLSSSFPLHVSNLDNLNTSTSHDIEVANVKGLNKKNIGYRKIFFKEDILCVADFIFSNRLFFTLIPKSINYEIHANLSFVFRFSDKNFILIFGPFKILFFES